MISDLEEHSRAMNTVNYQTIVHSRHKRPSKKQIFLVDNQGEWGAGGRKEGKRRDCHIGHNFNVLRRQDRRKERKRKEPVTSVTNFDVLRKQKGEKKAGAGHISHDFDAANGCCLHEIG